MSIAAICRKEVMTAKPETSLREVAKLMEAGNVGCVVVVSEGKPVGIITDRDMVLKALIPGRDLETTEARRIMSTDIITFAESMGTMQALEKARGKAARRFPVVDEGGLLVGIVTLDDIIGQVACKLSMVASILGQETPNVAAVVTAEPEENVLRVAGLMEQANVGTVVVVRDGKPLGIITDRDIMLRVQAAGQDATKLTAVRIMTPDPVVVNEDMGVYEILQRVKDQAARRFPVVSPDGRLTGIISIDDIVCQVAEKLEMIAGILAREAPNIMEL
ncbi:MAG: CBS domain-containing protein [Syntrophomonadaceae bacterium]|jgi:CBS domain-containing protein|nr:CBS domain-containing protein [Syntrophomonadaceae bacterium]MDH7497358.1 CBS domain-containing protein [Syntrophomonadaceae bacterium]